MSEPTFRDRVSTRPGIYGWWHILLDGNETGLLVRWTEYDDRGELRTVEDYPVTLAASRTAWLHSTRPLTPWSTVKKAA
jgi:hypothetical protein